MPVLWKKTNVLLVAKANPPMSIESDLRPISLTPTVSKVLEPIVRSWILELVGKQFDDHQFGALKGRSTTHAFVDMLHHWHLTKVTQFAFCLLNTRRLLIMPDHNTVLQKLKSYGVPDLIVHWMMSFLSDHQQRVKIN